MFLLFAPQKRRIARLTALWLSGSSRNLQAPFQIVGDGGQANLNAFLCKPSPSHLAQAVASFPCPEDFLDPAADTVDRLVPGIETCPDFGFVPAPHAGSDNAWRATLRDNCFAKMVASIGTVGINIAGIVRQCVRTSLAVIDVGGVMAISSTRAVSASAPTCALKPWTAGRPLCLTQ